MLSAKEAKKIAGNVQNQRRILKDKKQIEQQTKLVETKIAAAVNNGKNDVYIPGILNNTVLENLTKLGYTVSIQIADHNDIYSKKDKTIISWY